MKKYKNLEDFLNYINLVEKMHYKKFQDLYKDKEGLISLIEEFCSLLRVNPDYLFIHENLSLDMLNFISDIRFSTSDEEVIQTINKFICLYNSVQRGYDVIPGDEQYSKYRKVSLQYCHRFGDSISYFPSVFGELNDRPSIKEMLLSMIGVIDLDCLIDEKTESFYRCSINKGISELYKFESNDFIISTMLLQDNLEAKKRMYNNSYMSSRDVLISLNYIAYYCPQFLFFVNDNYSFVSYIFKSINSNDNNMLFKLKYSISDRIIEYIYNSSKDDGKKYVK